MEQISKKYWWVLLLLVGILLYLSYYWNRMFNQCMALNPQGLDLSGGGSIPIDDGTGNKPGRGFVN